MSITKSFVICYFTRRTRHLKSSKQCIKSAARARLVLGLLHPGLVRKIFNVLNLSNELLHGSLPPKPELRISSIQSLQLTSLYDRRLGGDIVETYKTLSGIEKVSGQQFFQLLSSPVVIAQEVTAYNSRSSDHDLIHGIIVQHRNSLLYQATSVTLFMRPLDDCTR